MAMPVGAQNVGQHGGVAGIGLSACLAAAFPVTGHRPRVDGEHSEAGQFVPDPAPGLDVGAVAVHQRHVMEAL
jgi:hypothetical protein